jgi:hypothetical protein
MPDQPTIIHAASTLGEHPDDWSVFASDIPLPPGQWPTDIHVIRGADRFRMQRTSPVHHHGQFAGFYYGDGDGHRLTVFND